MVEDIADYILSEGRRLHGRRGLKSNPDPKNKKRVESPPSRAAWIEIASHHPHCEAICVAAFTGGVD